MLISEASIIIFKMIVYVSWITLPLCAKITAHIEGFIVLDVLLIFWDYGI
jgi:hypothetical protein